MSMSLTVSTLSLSLSPGYVCHSSSLGFQPCSKASGPQLDRVTQGSSIVQGGEECPPWPRVSLLNGGRGDPPGRRGAPSREEEEAAARPQCEGLHRQRWPQDPPAAPAGDGRGGGEPGPHAPQRRHPPHGRAGPQAGAGGRLRRPAPLPTDEREADPRGAAEAAREAESQARYLTRC